MKISVIVPIFNDQLYIGSCIDSIKSQLYCDFEAILVDNASVDDSVKIALQTIGDDNRFRFISHTINSGASGARNSGIEEAKGDFIFFLDGDDKLAHNEALFDLLSVCEGCQIVQGDFIRSNGQIVSGDDNFTNVTNKLIDLNWLKNNNLYFIEGITYEDVPWAMKAYTCVDKYVNSHKVTYYHNLRQGSISRSVFDEFKVGSMLRVLKELTLLEQDEFVVERTVYQTMFLLKNLLLGDFNDDYKKIKYKELKNLGVLKLKYNGNSIEKFSKLLYKCRKSYLASNLLCKTYKNWKKC